MIPMSDMITAGQELEIERKKSSEHRFPSNSCTTGTHTQTPLAKISELHRATLFLEVVPTV